MSVTEAEVAGATASPEGGTGTVMSTDTSALALNAKAIVVVESVDEDDDDDDENQLFEDAVGDVEAEHSEAVEQEDHNATLQDANNAAYNDTAAPNNAKQAEEEPATAELESKRPAPLDHLELAPPQLSSSSTTTITTTASKPFVPLPASKNWRTMALRSTGKLSRLMQAALLKTLLHAIRRGSAEGVKVAIERGVMTQYIDGRSRNLLMYVAIELWLNA